MKGCNGVVALSSRSLKNSRAGKHDDFFCEAGGLRLVDLLGFLLAALTQTVPEVVCLEPCSP